MSRRPVAFIDQSVCDRCSTCAVGRICPNHAVVPDSPEPAAATSGAHTPSRLRSLLGKPHDRAWKVEEDKCAGCLLCAPYCPHQAVVPKERGRAA